MKNNKNLYLTILIVSVLVVVANFSYSLVNKKYGKNDLPAYAMRTPQVQAAYNHAVKDQELLVFIPCYCNCYRVGHKHVGECFVKEINRREEVVFDNHGSNCGICYNTILDVKFLEEQGKSTKEIREFIDNKYSRYGSPTNTPKP